jgi:predicted nucleic acid-binding protein
LDGEHRLDAPTEEELSLALDIADRYAESGVDLSDATVMAMAATRGALVLTWDFRHFRAVTLRRGRTWRLLVEEVDLPAP